MRKIWCTEAQRTHQLRMDDLPRQEEESQSKLEEKVNSLTDSRVFHDLQTKQLWVITTLFLVLLDCLLAILARSLIHRNYSVHPETILKIHLHPMNRQHFVQYF